MGRSDLRPVGVFRPCHKRSICKFILRQTVLRPEINNRNHKSPEDYLSRELSFFSLWQIWILLLGGTQMTCVSVCVCVYVSVCVYVGVCEYV